MNRLYFGDNLKWLSDRKEFPDASVDLVYLDLPFNSNADYNVLFREPSGAVSQAQFHAFTDTWSWADAAETYHAFIDNCPNVAVVEMMEAFHSFLKNSPMMAYLAMMAPRLVELHRVLKETGASICIAIQLPVITYEPCWMGSSMHETSERKLSGNGVVRTVMLLKDECSVDRFMTRYSFTRRVAIGRGIAFLLST